MSSCRAASEAWERLSKADGRPTTKPPAAQPLKCNYSGSGGLAMLLADDASGLQASRQHPKPPGSLTALGSLLGPRLSATR
ncbi:hypothetical protein NDU88_002059 [Pleurodeles waltl]|uniref:Uncharacterized protein n=1 Tax=Pleurodeles waltl TaxID=8319 RepID=A0AAV7KUH2_PLEWA|nr:hypothetical protein NDU88_002059 [Pleurodeles waltl]